MKPARGFSTAVALFGMLTGGTGLLSASVGFGFGPFKKPIELQSRQPAAVRLANTSLYFEGASTNKEYFPVQESLLVTLATELISHEKTLVVKDKRSEAEWTFAASITGYSVSPPGTRSEQAGGSNIVYSVWNGSLHLAYRVIDKHGKVYDAANVDSDYHREFEKSSSGKGSWMGMPSFNGFNHKKKADIVPSSPEDVKQILIKDVVRQVASKLGNTTDSLEVQVAGGEENLNHADEFMKNGLWSRSLDALQKAPPFAKPADESFHQYDFGVTYEAMSYEAKSSAEQRENIFKAAEYYDKALELNPGEKYFVSTIARARDAVARFQALDKMRASDIKLEKGSKGEDLKTAEDAKAVSAPTAKEPKSPSKTVALADVIAMHEAEVPDDQIIEYIQSAAQVDFDPTDKDTIISIAKAKLSVNVQNALRAKVKAPLLAPKPVRTVAAKKTQ